MKKLIVIDGNSLMFRAYYATSFTGNLLQARSGIYTNAILAFVNMFESVLKTEGMTHIFVAFDKGKKTFRHQMYDEYKAGRSKTPEEFLMQIPYIKEYLDILGVKRLELDDYEADDIVGSVANKFKDSFDEVMLISGDKDLLQLAKGNVHVYLTKKGLSDLDCYTEENFFEKMGIRSDQMIDFKGLIGDDSDNLPGVSGIGPKTAQKLLGTYGTLENIIANTNNLTKKMMENFEKDKDVALKSKKLATIYTTIDLDYTLDDLLYQEPNKNKLRLFYEKLDFNSLIKKLGASVDETKCEEQNSSKEELSFNLKIKYNLVEELIKDLQSSSIVSIEVELSEENYHHSQILGVSFYVNNNAYFIEKMFLYNDDLMKVLIKDDLLIYTVDSKKVIASFSKLGCNIKNIGFDFLLASYVVNPSYANSDVLYNMKNFLDVNFKTLEEVYTKKTKYVIPSLDTLGEYACRKAFYLPSLKKIIDDTLSKDEQLDLLYKIEIPLSIVLCDMELAGFKVNQKRLEEIGVICQEKMNVLEKEIYECAGMQFNIASPKQLGDILFDKLKIAKGKKNKTGYVTDAQTLEKLKYVHPIPMLVLEYRKYAKLKGTYVDGIIDVLNPKDQKVHTIYKQALTLTGRLSSVEPNIQNIPIKTEDGRLIRSAFEPSFTNGMLVSADYSQIELRILAHLSNCHNMLEAFNLGIDLHASTASKIYECPLNEVTKEMRRIAKAVNFGIVYGMSAFGLSEELHIEVNKAKEFIDKYFAIYPEIKTYLDDVVNDCKKLGYTTTLYKRKRYMPEINSSNFALRSFAERTAKNAPIQGTAADIIKIAMINVYHEFNKFNLKSKLIAQVHDELVVDTKEDEIEIVKKILKETMEKVVTLNVRLNAEVSIGNNWDMK